MGGVAGLDRDAWIGWTPEQRCHRLRWVANNARFLMLPDAHRLRLGSRMLGLAALRAAEEKGSPIEPMTG